MHEILPYPRIYILTSSWNMRRMEEGSGAQIFFMGRKKKKEEEKSTFSPWIPN